MLKIYLSSLLLKVKGMPDNAAELHEFIHGRKAPKLEGVRFSVLALAIKRMNTSVKQVVTLIES